MSIPTRLRTYSRTSPEGKSSEKISGKVFAFSAVDGVAEELTGKISMMRTLSGRTHPSSTHTSTRQSLPRTNTAARPREGKVRS